MNGARVAAIATLLFGALTTGAEQSAAQECTRVTGSTSAFDAAVCRRSQGGQAPNGGGGTQSHGAVKTRVTYTYKAVCQRGAGVAGDSFYGCGGQAVCRQNGEVFQIFANYAGGRSQSLGTRCIEPQVARSLNATARQVTPPMVARAFRRVPLPDSEVAIQPPGGETLVNLPTVFSTEAEPFRRTLTLLGQQVELDIAPTSFTWHHGDGTSQRTDEPGQPYQRGLSMSAYVTHEYSSLAEQLTPRVDTVWSARFRVNGGPWRDVGETVTVTGPPATLAVLEAEPDLVGS